MGYGTQLKVSFVDPRASHKDAKLKIIPNSVHTKYMNNFSIMNCQTINNKGSSGDAYCEFEAGEDGQASIAFNVIFQEQEVAKLTFEINQIYHVFQDNEHFTTFTFSCPNNDYALEVRNNGITYLYLPDQINKIHLSAYPSNQKIDGAPGHWSSGNSYPDGWLEFNVLYVGIADFPVNRLSSLCSHNSFTSPETGYIYYQQNTDIKNQINNGVRSLMLDTYWYRDEIVLAHGEPGTLKYRIQKILPSSAPEPLKNTFEVLKEYLSNNKEEYIFIFFEDYVKDSEKWYKFLSNYSEIIYGFNQTKITYDDFKVTAENRDTKARISDIKGKLILFIDTEKSSFIPYIWNYCIETVYGDDSLSKNLKESMKQRSESSAKTNFKNYNDKPFLIVNNFSTFDISLAIRNYGLEVGTISLILRNALPIFFSVTNLAFVAAAFAAIAWKAEINKRNNGQRLIEKAKWAHTTPTNQSDIDQGHYGKLPNFFSIDFVTEGSAISGVGYSNATMINDWIEEQSKIYPNEIPLGIFGLSGKNIKASYSYEETGEKSPLNVSNDAIYLTTPENNKSCNVIITYENHLIDKNIISLKPIFTEDGKNIFWDIEFKKFFIATEIYTKNSSSAYFIDLNKNEKHDLNLITIDDVEYIELSKNFESKESEVFQVYIVENNSKKEILCGTFVENIGNFTLIPNISNKENLSKTNNLYAIKSDHKILEIINRMIKKRNLNIFKNSESILFLPFATPNFTIKSINSDGTPNYYPIEISIAETATKVDFDYFSFEFSTDNLNDEETYHIQVKDLEKNQMKNILNFSIKKENGEVKFNSIEYI